MENKSNNEFEIFNDKGEKIMIGEIIGLIIMAILVLFIYYCLVISKDD